MTLNPTAVAPNPRYRGAKPRERETQERELEIERTKQGRKRGDYGGRGETYRIYEEERIEREREIEKEKARDYAVEREYSSRDQYSRVLRSFILPRPSALSTHFLSFSFPFVHPLFPVALFLSFSLSHSLLLCLSPVSPFSHPPRAAIFIPPVAPLIVVVAVIWRPIVAPNTNGAKGRELSEGRRREGNLKREKA